MKCVFQNETPVKIDFKECNFGKSKEDFIWTRVVWAKQTCSGKFRYDSTKRAFCFEKEEDAVAFKIYWT